MVHAFVEWGAPLPPYTWNKHAVVLMMMDTPNKGHLILMALCRLICIETSSILSLAKKRVQVFQNDLGLTFFSPKRTRDSRTNCRGRILGVRAQWSSCVAARVGYVTVLLCDSSVFLHTPPPSCSCSLYLLTVGEQEEQEAEGPVIGRL